MATWGSLLRGDDEILSLTEDSYILGRSSKKAHTALTFANPRISTAHCRLYRPRYEDDEREDDPKHEQAFVCDVSTNGTFLNDHKLQKNKPVILRDGDVISMPLPSTAKEADNIVLVFKARKETPAPTAEICATLVDEPSTIEISVDPESEHSDQEEEQEPREVKSPPVSDVPSHVPVPPTNTSSPPSSPPIPEDASSSPVQEHSANASPPSSPQEPKMDEEESHPEPPSTTEGPTETNEEASTEPHPEPTPAATTTEAPVQATEDAMDEDPPQEPSGTTQPTVAGKRAREEPDPGSAESPIKESPQKIRKIEEEEEEEDDIEQNLCCRICQDILYKPVSISPCFHDFCMSCLSEWKQRSQSCPVCRKVIHNYGRNHTLANLVEAYLKTHPSKARDPAELAEMDKRNKITEAELSGNSPKFKSSYRNYDDYDDEEEEEEEEEEHGCERCRTPGPDGFQCGESQEHHNCNSCGQLFPVRDGVATKCAICKCNFCHPVIPCRAFVRASLRPLKEAEVTDVPAAPYFNMHERAILLHFLHTENQLPVNRYASPITILWKECMKELAAGNYSVASHPALTPDTPVCARCVTQMVTELAYQYRRDIPKAKLSAEVTGRQDCYWGKNCKTQTHNLRHAKNFNHICEQTRF